MCAPRVTRHTSIRYSSSCYKRVNMSAFCLHRHAVSVNCLYHARMVLSAGGPFAYFARNARCTVTTDLLCDIPTHKTTSTPERPFSHYIHSHRLAAEMWTVTKNNLPGEKMLRVVPYFCTGFVNTCPTLNKERPTWCHLLFVSLFNTQHVSDVNTSILGSLRLIWCVIT